MAMADYSSMLADLRATFESARTRSLSWRAEQLAALERLMVECGQEIMDALKAVLGMAPQEAGATGISFVSADAAYCRKHL